VYVLSRESEGEQWAEYQFEVKNRNFSGGSSQSATPTGSSKAGYVSDSDGSTNLRSQPTASSKLIQKVYNGTKFSVVSWAGDWLNIRLANGATGYIHKTRAKFTN
jgi:uncharacterized protein YgiM (DUF1202 family)